MIRIRGPTDVGQVPGQDLQRLIRLRLSQLSQAEPYDTEIHGEMVVVEPSDTLQSLEEGSGVPIASNPFDDARFPDPDFVPVCEYLEEHSHCYEMMFLFSDDGAGTTFFIPKSPGIAADLLTLCAKFAEPAFQPAPT